jgi:hypothetical protein
VRGLDHGGQSDGERAECLHEGLLDSLIPLGARSY